MSSMSRTSLFAVVFVVGLLYFAAPALAFGAGNIPSLAKVEGVNFRHGDIEDVLKKLLFLKGAKWTSKLVKRVYFGNWLRDYSQAVDVGTVKSVPASTIRVLVWLLAFMSFGYATGEFEVTDERLGVYRPEEHIDNPKDYADNEDARLYDGRLRPPVHPTELAIDPLTCMKNYIANENLGIATSAGYIKHSLNRSIHFGRLYTSGPPGDANNEAHLNEALRCLGQALHTLEDFSAHSNYVELVLREMGMLSVFPHVGLATEMVLANGKRVFPLTTGTFGGVDFLHSVLGEASDKFAQTELQEMDGVLEAAHNENKKQGSRHVQTSMLKDILSKIPNCSALLAEADKLEAESDARDFQNMTLADPSQYGSKGAVRAKDGFDAVKLSKDIYPILQFRDNVVKTIGATMEQITENIPGLPAFEDLMDQISDTLSIYVFSVLSPYIRPIIAQANAELKEGSTEVLKSAKDHQYEVWTNAYSTDPTHSMLSKDHFSNVLNQPAGMVAMRVVEYVVPRVIFAWEHVGADLGLILNDIVRVLHHPGLRDPQSEIQMGMFDVVAKWAESYPGGRPALEAVLNSEAVKNHKNHKGGVLADCGHGKMRGGEWDKVGSHGDKDKKKKKSSGSGKDKKREDSFKIGGVTVPLGALQTGAASGSGGQGGILGGVMGGLASAALAGYKGDGFPAEKEKDKYGSIKEKDRKDYKENKEKKKEKDADYYERKEREKKKKEKDPDYYEKKSSKDKRRDKDDEEDEKDSDYYREKERKKKEKEKKEKEKYGSTSSAKYKSSRKDYSDDEDTGDDRRGPYTSSSGKYRTSSPKHSSSSRHRSDSHKRSGSRDRDRRDYGRNRHHEAMPGGFNYEVTVDTVETHIPSHHHHHDHDHDHHSDYKYEYAPPRISPSADAYLNPYGTASPYDRPDRRSKSRSRSRVRNEVEYVVPVPPAPPAPEMPGGFGDAYEEDVRIMKASYSRAEGKVGYYVDDGVYGGEPHKGYGEGWQGGYGRDYGY